MKTLKKLISQPTFYFFFFAVCFMYVYRSLLSDLSGSLLDRLDYPYIVWVINGNIQNLLSGNFAHYFDTRGFYPHPYGLLFSDILLPQSLMILPIYVLTKNIILSFNFIYIATYFLDFTAAYIFWKHFFKSSFVAGIGALLIVFGPFYHMQMGHFQMQSYWVGLFGLVLLFKCIEKPRWQAALAGGLLLGIQFTASVYTFVFFSAFAAVIWGISWLYAEKRFEIFKHAVLFFGAMALFITPFVKAYYSMKHYYSMQREISEIILYAAHISDYMFTNVYRSILYHLPFWAKWNIFDKHVIGEKAVFPGFFLVVFACIGLFRLIKSKKTFALHMPLDKFSVIFGIAGFAGFVASLGPRLSFNGAYAHIPTPYLVGLKVLPLLDSIRCPTRWGFLFIIALIFFALRGVEKVRGRLSSGTQMLAGILLVIWILFEYLPQPLTVYTVPRFAPEYVQLQKICADEPKAVLLEYPITHFTAFGGIVEGLGYISGVQLAQVSHNCLLMNGYSGFIPDGVFATEQLMNEIVSTGDVEKLHSFMKANKISLIKFNKKFVLKENTTGFANLQELLELDKRFIMISNGLFRLDK